MIISSNLLTMRKTEVTDLLFVIETESDQENKPFIGQWTLEQHTESMTNEDMLHLIIEDKQGEKIGYLIITGLQDPNNSVCIRRITIRVKGQGYGKEAIELLIAWIFEHTSAHRIWLDVKDFNVRARHIYESKGFTLEGTLRDCILKEGKYESLSIMSILRHEFVHIHTVSLNQSGGLNES